MTSWARGPEFRRNARRKRAELHHCAPVPPGFPGMNRPVFGGGKILRE